MHDVRFKGETQELVVSFGHPFDDSFNHMFCLFDTQNTIISTYIQAVG